MTEETHIYVPNEGKYPDDAVVMSIEEHTDAVKFFPLGGGFAYRVPRADFFDDFRAATLEERALVRPLRKAKFKLDGDCDEYVGYTDGMKWNGWATPVFAADEAYRMARKEGWLQLFVNDHRAYTEMPGHDDGEGGCVYEKFECELVLTVDGVVQVWPIGTMGWCWMEVEETQ